MMLYVENLEKASRLELAMLLDESPSPAFGDSRSRWLEPWAQGGALASCATSARQQGHAKLFLVFESDARPTWGSRVVTAMSGGLLFAESRPTRPLTFEVVARSIFKNVVGRNTASPFRVIEDVALMPDPGCETYRNGKNHHDILGFVVPDAGKGPRSSRQHLGDTQALRSGFCVVWVDQTGYSEVWFVADAPGFQDFEFGLHEYARRRYVGVVLNILGFVAGPAKMNDVDAAQSLLSGALPQLIALESLCAKGVASYAPASSGITQMVTGNSAGSRQSNIEPSYHKSSLEPVKQMHSGATDAQSSPAVAHGLSGADKNNRLAVKLDVGNKLTLKAEAVSPSSDLRTAHALPSKCKPVATDDSRSSGSAAKPSNLQRPIDWRPNVKMSFNQKPAAVISKFPVRRPLGNSTLGSAPRSLSSDHRQGRSFSAANGNGSERRNSFHDPKAVASLRSRTPEVGLPGAAAALGFHFQAGLASGVTGAGSSGSATATRATTSPQRRKTTSPVRYAKRPPSIAQGVQGGSAASNSGGSTGFVPFSPTNGIGAKVGAGLYNPMPSVPSISTVSPQRVSYPGSAASNASGALIARAASGSCPVSSAMSAPCPQSGYPNVLMQPSGVLPRAAVAGPAAHAPPAAYYGPHTPVGSASIAHTPVVSAPNARAAVAPAPVTPVFGVHASSAPPLAPAPVPVASTAIPVSSSPVGLPVASVPVAPSVASVPANLPVAPVPVTSPVASAFAAPIAHSLASRASVAHSPIASAAVASAPVACPLSGPAPATQSHVARTPVAPVPVARTSGAPLPVARIPVAPAAAVATASLAECRPQVVGTQAGAKTCAAAMPSSATATAAYAAIPSAVEAAPPRQSSVDAPGSNSKPMTSSVLPVAVELSPAQTEICEELGSSKANPNKSVRRPPVSDKRGALQYPDIIDLG